MRGGVTQGEIDTGKDMSMDTLLRPFVENMCAAELTLWGDMILLDSRNI